MPTKREKYFILRKTKNIEMRKIKEKGDKKNFIVFFLLKNILYQKENTYTKDS